MIATKNRVRSLVFYAGMIFCGTLVTWGAFRGRLPLVFATDLPSRRLRMGTSGSLAAGAGASVPLGVLLRLLASPSADALNSAGFEAFPPTNCQLRDASLFAQRGLGTAANPWTGWEDAVSSAPAGTWVALPAGYYTVSKQIQIPDGVRVSGAGVGKTVLRLMAHAAWIENGGTHSVMTNAGGAKEITIEGFTLDGNRANLTGAAPNNWSGAVWARNVDLRGVSNLVVRNLETMGATAEGLFIGDVTSAEVYDVVAHDNATVGMSFGAGSPQVLPVNRSVFANLTSYDNQSLGNTGYDGFFIDHAFDCTFSDLVAYGTRTAMQGPLFEGFSGIKVVASERNVFTRITAFQNQWQGLHLAASTSNTFTDATLRGNNFTNFSGAGNGLLIVGRSTYNRFVGMRIEENLDGVFIFDDGNDFNSFFGNIITGQNGRGFGRGVRLRGQHNLFVGNVIKGNGSDGVTLDVAGAGHNRFLANQIVGNQGYAWNGGGFLPVIISVGNDVSGNAAGTAQGVVIISTEAVKRFPPITAPGVVTPR